MDKKVVITAIVTLLLICFSLGYSFFPRDEKVPVNSSDDTAASTPDDKKPVEDNALGEYKEYSEDAVYATTGIKLLFFHASWCPQCRSIEADIKENGLPDNVTVFKVDYDSNQHLRQRYGVTIQTTFVKVDDSGNKIESYVAYEEPVFSSVERELLR